VFGKEFLYFPWNSVEFCLSSVILLVMSHLNDLHANKGVRGSVVVKALCYMLEGRGFETQ
jgi:hypothetical protein